MMIRGGVRAERWRGPGEQWCGVCEAAFHASGHDYTPVGRLPRRRSNARLRTSRGRVFCNVLILHAHETDRSSALCLGEVDLQRLACSITCVTPSLIALPLPLPSPSPSRSPWPHKVLPGHVGFLFCKPGATGRLDLDGAHPSNAARCRCFLVGADGEEQKSRLPGRARC
jgi:hypothetical protein